LRHHLARRDAFHQERAEIAVERKNPVVRPQAEAGSDDDRFLADTCVDAAANLPLSHTEAQAFVERANELEPVVHLEELVGAELEFRAFDWRARFDLGIAY
jgi:hypothetical protein